MRTRDHGVTAEFIKAMKAEGFTGATIEELVRAKDHGVSRRVRAGAAFEGRESHATLDGYVRLRDHGVTADYITDMKGIGLNGLTAEDLVRLHDHGVTPGFVNHLRAQGFKEDTADGLIRLKNRGLWR